MIISLIGKSNFRALINHRLLWIANQISIKIQSPIEWSTGFKIAVALVSHVVSLWEVRLRARTALLFHFLLYRRMGNIVCFFYVTLSSHYMATSRGRWAHQVYPLVITSSDWLIGWFKRYVNSLGIMYALRLERRINCTIIDSYLHFSVIVLKEFFVHSYVIWSIPI